MIRSFQGLVVAASLLTLAGCVSILPRDKPVQLYRFGAQSPSAANAGPRRAVILTGVSLPAAARGDGLLTLQGDQAAYIAGARWVVPAAVMFQEALVTGLEGGAAHLRIVRPGDAGAVLGVRVDVRRFETDYEGGRPVVAIDAVVRVTSTAGLAQSERHVSIRTPASENRVSAIVAAYDAAMARIIDGAAEAINAAPAAAR